VQPVRLQIDRSIRILSAPNCPFDGIGHDMTAANKVL
jgi:hypothetical protein